MNTLVIICVDDEKIILDALRTQLERNFGARFVYETAESVEEAWEVIEDLQADDHTIALVISDWLMPKVKGDKFIVDLYKKMPDTPSIMLTGQADESAIANAIQNGNLFAYLRKPWKTEQLISRITEAVKEHLAQSSG